MSVRVLREVELAVFSGRAGPVKLRLVKFEGVGIRLDLRRFFEENGKSLPTRQGIAIRAEWAEKLREGLERLERETAKGG
jgi:hypothetical protein